MEDLYKKHQQYVQDEQTKQQIAFENTRNNMDKDACREWHESYFIRHGHFAKDFFAYPCTRRIDGVSVPHEKSKLWFQCRNPGFVIVGWEGRESYMRMTHEAFPEYIKN